MAPVDCCDGDSSPTSSRRPLDEDVPCGWMPLGRQNSPLSPRTKVVLGLGESEIEEGELDIGEVIGEGASSKVYAASWNGKAVAVKEFRQRVGRMNAKCRRDLARELAILQSVRHEHVLHMFGVVPFKPVRIVTDLCEGGSLFDLLHTQRQTPLTWLQRIKICSDTADAVEYLHSFEPPIIHRDLKSLNLLLSTPVESRDDVPNVKLSDFGLSRPKRQCSDSAFMTVAVGTHLWMAPELMIGGNYDEKVDVYAFAMIVYEIVCRAVPWSDLEEEEDDDADFRQLESRVCKGERPSLALCPPDCPPMFKSLMKLCWHHLAEFRPDFLHIQKYLGMLRCELSRQQEQQQGGDRCCAVHALVEPEAPLVLVA